jgi:hypothetical protein
MVVEGLSLPRQAPKARLAPARSSLVTPMPLYRYERPRAKHPFVGTWHITEMEMWDADYMHMERQAYVEIEPGDHGSFQFGLVCGELHGYLEEEGPTQRFAFTWEGNDEMDPASGSGWMRLETEDTAAGRIAIHRGDHSRFTARRVGPRPAAGGRTARPDDAGGQPKRRRR